MKSLLQQWLMLGLMCGVSVSAAAGTVHDALTMVKSKGYHSISELELERDRYYEITALDVNNQKVELVYDTQSNKLVSQSKQTDGLLSLEQVLKKLDVSTTQKVLEVEFEQASLGAPYYEIKLVKSGQQQKVCVDAKSGQTQPC